MLPCRGANVRSGESTETAVGLFPPVHGAGHGPFHCLGGPGPNRFDAVAALRAWVEHGKAPDRLVAAKPADDRHPKSAVLRTRPLCPYPAVARWTGKGSSDQAANFTCASVN
ncbi:tannase/feruloyl esterase family alpha/beta hydrolase [Azospirillum sp. B4]|uniref:tannase/feruloyl esterase family alpha/beta hydrolase n=1 Tax=Azospirillum sp. B4 TaxID=95605 RepID=UPI00131F0085